MKLILDWDRGKWFQLFKSSKHNPLELHIPEIENLWFPPTGAIVHEQIDKKGRSLLKTLQQFIADKLRYSDLQIELVDGFKIFRRYCSRTVPEAVKQLSGCYRFIWSDLKVWDHHANDGEDSQKFRKVSTISQQSIGMCVWSHHSCLDQK